jgi:hypothetical protein
VNVTDSSSAERLGATITSHNPKDTEISLRHSNSSFQDGGDDGGVGSLVKGILSHTCVFPLTPSNCYYPHSIDEEIEARGGLRETQKYPRSYIEYIMAPDFKTKAYAFCCCANNVVNIELPYSHLGQTCSEEHQLGKNQFQNYSVD